jgi:hypothetical protein
LTDKSLLHLWILAEKLAILGLQNAAIDYLRKGYKGDAQICTSDLRYVYKKTKAG